MSHAVPLTDVDRKLLRELLSGHSGSWTVFVDRFTGLMMQVIHQTANAHSLKLSDDDVEDLCAETFAELLARDMGVLRNFRGRCSLATYLAVIVRRIVVRRLMQRRFREAMGHVDAHQSSLETASADAGDLRQVDARDEVEALLVRLPPESRQIAAWYFLEHASYQTIAKRLQKPLNSIGPLLTRIRHSLTRAAKAGH